MAELGKFFGNLSARGEKPMPQIKTKKVVKRGKMPVYPAGETSERGQSIADPVCILDEPANENSVTATNSENPSKSTDEGPNQQAITDSRTPADTPLDMDVFPSSSGTLMLSMNLGNEVSSAEAQQTNVDLDQEKQFAGEEQAEKQVPSQVLATADLATVRENPRSLGQVASDIMEERGPSEKKKPF